jgi:hypothetical protein
MLSGEQSIHVDTSPLHHSTTPPSGPLAADRKRARWRRGGLDALQPHWPDWWAGVPVVCRDYHSHPHPHLSPSPAPPFSHPHPHPHKCTFTSLTSTFNLDLRGQYYYYYYHYYYYYYAPPLIYIYTHPWHPQGQRPGSSPKGCRTAPLLPHSQGLRFYTARREMREPTFAPSAPPERVRWRGPLLRQGRSGV